MTVTDDILKFVLTGQRTGNQICSKFGLSRNQFYREKENLRFRGFPLKYDPSTKTYSVLKLAKLTDEELTIVQRMGQMDLTKEQTDTLLKNLFQKPPQKKPVTVLTDKKKVIFLAIADLHAGSDFYVEQLLETAGAEQDWIDFVINAGDSVEGMSGRVDQILNLSYHGLGITRQARYLAEELEKFNGIPVYSIEAQNSHGGWSNASHRGAQGLNIGEYLELMSAKYGNGEYRFLGFDNGQVNVNGLRILMWHPKNQTIESYLDKTPDILKPHIVVVGHYHSKIGTYRYRGVHIIHTGTAQSTTPFIKASGGQSIVGYYRVWVETGVDSTGTTILKRIGTEFVEIPLEEP